MLHINSPRVTYTPHEITSVVSYETSLVAQRPDGVYEVTPRSVDITFRTRTVVPRVGVMLVGWGGNNGSTVTAGILANKLGLSWQTRTGQRSANYLGSLTQSSTVRIGADAAGRDVWVGFNQLLPMLHPNDLVVDGWDISSLDLAHSMKRAQVLDYDLQRQLHDHMKQFKPRPSIYSPDFIAANQAERADNVLVGTKQQQLDQLRADIRQFKHDNRLDKVLVLWTANTERLCRVQPGLNDTAANLLRSIADESCSEISPSTLFAVASLLEGCSYINGSPQNTFVPGVMELAQQHSVYIGGDDFKSGQTKLKSVLVDYLVGAGLKPRAIVSYNHLGNNDGKNLSAPPQFHSKELSKSNVVDDMVGSNRLLYRDPEDRPDHVVVIKYVPAVGDSKRAMDEYTSEIFLGGSNTLVIHNTCEDSLLAAPLIFDLVILTELCERISFKVAGELAYHGFHPVLSLLGYLLKAPLVPEGTPVVNALFRQRACIENILRCCVGLPLDNNMLLEHKLPKNSVSFEPFR